MAKPKCRGRKGPYSKPKDRTDYAKRRCLSCGKLFKSSWVGNRICGACRLSTRKTKGGIDETPQSFGAGGPR